MITNFDSNFNLIKQSCKEFTVVYKINNKKEEEEEEN
jgi:hypothetical protein